MGLWRLGTKAIHLLDPETAHKATVSLLGAGLGPRRRPDLYPSLATSVAGLDLPNPLGLAAGFDKNAQAVDACLKMGFGFVEAGAVTPRPQPGNERPRVFRLPHDLGVINRYGFNNDGLDAIAARLEARKGHGGIVGINLGANKDAEDRLADFVTGAERLSPCVSFCTVNVSSPNTPGLRAMQERGVLETLLARVRGAMTDDTKLFLKIAPDLTDEDRADLVEIAKTSPIDALIVSNTTLEREMLSQDPEEAGGLSGRPLFELSTRRLEEFARALGGAVPLIGVGGILTADDAYMKILKGASLLQLYTGLIYKGPDLVTDILAGLNERLAADGYGHVAGAVGQGL